ncbi:unnamed protein product [Caenorhabditis auriculariae]|uniref:Methyltransferase domain-containing protein n=1 Tax=Caenorhabditis auriculariae TaxID=2777116 RepID=A0A8S1H724_9PELO|nr:unnamed protein product [Caenorhabditis auriculariae]
MAGRENCVFSLVTARQAASAEDYETALPNYLGSLYQLPLAERTQYLDEFCDVFYKWLLAENEDMSRALNLLPNLRQLFPNTCRVLFIVNKHLYDNSRNEMHLFECLKLCREILHIATSAEERTVARIMQANLRSGAFDQWHIRMINDEDRNRKFEQALKLRIKNEEDVVYDIGTGSGLLSVYAARCSKNVRAIEENVALLDIAKKVFTRNAVADRVSLLFGNSNDLYLDEKADVICAEILDCCVFGEHVVRSFISAHERLAKPSTVFIPSKATVYLRVLECEEEYKNFSKDFEGRRYISKFCGLSEEDGDYWCHTVSDLPNPRYLSPSVPFIDVDFQSLSALRSLSNVEKHFPMPIVASGTAHFLVVHFRSELAPGVELDSSELGSCWDQGIYPFAFAVPVEQGGDLPVVANLLDGHLLNVYPEETVFRDMMQEIAPRIRLVDNLLRMENRQTCEWLLEQLRDEPLDKVRNCTKFRLLDIWLEPFMNQEEERRNGELKHYTTMLAWPGAYDGSLDDGVIRQIFETDFNTVQRIFPEAVTIRGCLFSSKSLAALSRPDPSKHGDVDLSPISTYSLFEYRELDLARSDIFFCSDEFDLITMIFSRENIASKIYELIYKQLDVKPTSNGGIDGVLYWFSSTGYDNKKDLCASFLFSQPFMVSTDDTIRLTLDLHKGNMLITGEKL